MKIVIQARVKAALAVSICALREYKLRSNTAYVVGTFVSIEGALQIELLLSYYIYRMTS